MAFYKKCACGHKNVFEHRALAPRKCEECGRSLMSILTFDEDAEVPPTAEEAPAPQAPSGFYFSLDAVDGSGTISLPEEGGVVGRAALNKVKLVGDRNERFRSSSRYAYKGS